MGRHIGPGGARSSVGLMAARERGEVQRQFKSRMTVTDSMIDRLGLEKELVGHTGCVNCLEWNHDGSILASASDDLHISLWDPFRYKLLHNIRTGHNGNIFSVKFLTPDLLATCAADSTVRVRSVLDNSQVLECFCHCGRAKRLATAPANPHLIWSAAEDGVIIQHDLRESHNCNSNNANVLINLVNHIGRAAEAKCLAINPRRPHYLAVGANDFYVRMYDMRMIKLACADMGDLQGMGPHQRWERQNMRCRRAGEGDPEQNIPIEAAQYFAPGHLSIDPSEHVFPKKSVTYVTFNDDGNELLVNLGSEQIYLFNIDNGNRPILVESFITSYKEEERLNGTVDANDLLNDRAKVLKEMANECMSKGEFARALELYNAAIRFSPQCALLYSNRAAALSRRAWSGDKYAAIRDCYRAIGLDGEHAKSYFRLSKALMEIKRPLEANQCLNYFKQRFPKHSSSHAIFLLQKEINEALKKNDTTSGESSNDSEDNAKQSTSELEERLRLLSIDYHHRFVGHCNTTTDIKEANFIGPNAEYIAAGSDDGSIFIWSRSSGNIVRILKGDESIVNCIQPHHNSCLLATSGMEPVVRLWSPRPEEGYSEPRLVLDLGQAASENQRRMLSDPFETMLFNISIARAEQDQPAACRTT